MKKTILISLLLLFCSSLVYGFGLRIGGSDTDIGSFFQGSDDDDTTKAVQSIWKLVKAGKSAIKSFEDLTPEQEYYLGRAAAAQVLGTHKAVNLKQPHYYLNSLANYLAQFSSRPETYSGYRVQVIDSPDVRAYSTPGGFIILSNTLLKLCENEDELASVIAHEIGHISHQHGLSAIKTSHLTEAGKILSSFALDSNQSFSQSMMLKKSFGGSVDDIVVQLIDSGYSQSQETDADTEAVKILKRAGYQPTSLKKFIAKTMTREKKPDNNDFFNTNQATIDLKNAFNQTHPGSDKRITQIGKLIKQERIKDAQIPNKRTQRFNNNVVKLLP